MPGTDDLQYWLHKATEINSNSYDSEANTFIRAVTRAGLLFDDKGESNLQYNSDVIGAAVIGDILKYGTIASVPELIPADVEAALKERGQTIGGWGGAFYYWNLILADGKSVGFHIQNNFIDFDKFIAATAKATADTVAKLGISVEQFVSASNAQVSWGVMSLIIDRVLDTLSGAVPSFAGDPENIDGYRPIHGENDAVVGWKYNTPDQIGLPVTDSNLLDKLNLRYAYCAKLSDSEAFGTRIDQPIGLYGTAAHRRRPSGAGGGNYLGAGGDRLTDR